MWCGIDSSGHVETTGWGFNLLWQFTAPKFTTTIGGRVLGRKRL